MAGTAPGKAVVVAAMLALAACGAATDRESAQPQEVNLTSAPAEATPVGTLPPATAPLRFVGRWAADAGSCRDKAWEFKPESLHTPGGSACSFIKTRNVDGGYDIEANCAAEGPARSDRLKIRFAESAQAMLFESDTVADAGLIYCSPIERDR